MLLRNLKFNFSLYNPSFTFFKQKLILHKLATQPAKCPIIFGKVKPNKWKVKKMCAQNFAKISITLLIQHYIVSSSKLFFSSSSYNALALACNNLNSSLCKKAVKNRRNLYNPYLHFMFKKKKRNIKYSRRAYLKRFRHINTHIYFDKTHKKKSS